MRWNDYIGELVMWALIVCMVWWLLLLSGCTTAKYVPYKEFHTEYIIRTDTLARMDSIYLHDSIYTYHTGDTVYVTKVSYKDRFRNVYRVRTDTLWRTDSTRVPYPIEKTLTKQEQSFMNLGRYSLGFLVGLVIILAVRLIWWYINKKC